MIIAANRDEFYQRASKPMQFWADNNTLAGQDMEAGGTWLALSRQGRFAAVTNVREPAGPPAHYSRGRLPLAFIKSEVDAQAFLTDLKQQQDAYAGFNIIAGDLHNNSWLYASNRWPRVETIDDGIHGLSNAHLDSDWPKITDARRDINALLNRPFEQEDWFAMLADQRAASDERLPDTGIGLQGERLLAPRFIVSDKYGTRSSTLVAVNKKGGIKVAERNFDGDKPETRFFDFFIETNNKN